MASNGNEDAHSLLHDVIASEETSSVNQIYNKWAQKYEHDMRAVKYFGPEKLMEYFDKFGLPEGAKILDVCAGTGGIGRELASKGFTNNHAIDGSEAMLEKAKLEGNYKSYTHMLFGPDTKMPFGDGEFDGVLFAGVFAPGHLPIVTLREICRVTKVGGVVAFILCDPKYYEDKDKQYADGGFYKIVDDLCNRGIWKKRDGFPISVPYIEYSDGFVMAFDIIGK